MELVGPVTRSSEIHARLRGAILGGAYAPGDALPSERQLSDELGAGRHAVREALKRLQQAGLVSISQGGATRVRDWRRHGGLDLLLALGAEGQAPPELGLVRATLEMRASVGADAARLCALRADDATRAEVDRARRGARGHRRPGRAAGQLRRALGPRRSTARATSPTGWRSTHSSRASGCSPSTPRSSAPRSPTTRRSRALARAIAAGEADGAHACARDLLDRSIGEV